MKILIPIILCFGAVLIHCSTEKRFKRDAIDDAFINLVKEDDVAKVEEMFQNGMALDLINTVDGGGRTKLFLAVNNGKIEMVKLLLRNGGDVKKPNKFGQTPLFAATLNGDEDMLALLMKNGADLDVPKLDNYTCLNMAAKYGYLRIVEMLLKAGADVTRSSDDNQSPLYSAVVNGHEEVVAMLLQYGADVNTQAVGGWSPLHRAVEQGFEKIVYMLKQKGAEVLSKNKNNETSLDIAQRLGNQNIVNILRFGTTMAPPTVAPTASAELPPTVPAELPPTVPSTTPKTTTHVPETTTVCVPPVTTTQPPPMRSLQEACRKYTNVRTLYTRPDNVKEYPWMVALGYTNTKQNKTVNFYCGGIIISKNFVLAAAHCITYKYPSVVRMGTESMNNGKARTVNRNIKEVIVHPEYSIEKRVNDIALIELADNIPFSYKISPACLHAKSDDLPSNVTLVLTTWEAKSPDLNGESKRLRKMGLESVPMTECNLKLLAWNQRANLLYLRDGLTVRQYCAIDPRETNETCKGDGGGVLQYFPGNTRTATVVGIASFSPECNPKLPAVYTRIASHLDWIEFYVWPKH